MHAASTQKRTRAHTLTYAHEHIYITLIDSSSIPRSDYLHTFNATAVRAANVLAYAQDSCCSGCSHADTKIQQVLQALGS